jgi:two-component system osmolarity sensor histidine kinase EnvZ
MSLSPTTVPPRRTQKPFDFRSPVTLVPRSLFWRLALLLFAIILVAQIASILLFREDRAALVTRQFGDTKIVQIQALRAALASPDARDRAGHLARLGAEYHAQLMPVSERALIGHPPRAPFMINLVEHVRERLGPEADVRVQNLPGGNILWIKLVTPNGDYWAGFTIAPRRAAELPLRLLGWSAFIFSLLLASAWAFVRILNRPLRQLERAVAVLGQGHTPPPLPETGPSEIASLSRSFNQMTVNLRQMEEDRALLLAGVSHDLRTPLARLRLGVEMSANDEAMQQGMVDDIEEMDRTISQFLDFARGEDTIAAGAADLEAIIGRVVERQQRKGRTITFARDTLPLMVLRETAIERLLANLIDNAFRYGSKSVDVSARLAGGGVVLEVADRGPGIPPDQVERLKRPFTRLDSARGGVLGSGLGLAIVDRIARLHDGQFDLLPREGGGTIARVTLPLERSQAHPQGNA